MQDHGLQFLADLLATNRTSRTTSDIAFGVIHDEAEAAEVQAAAVASYTNDVVGFSVIGTSGRSRSLLGIDRPIYGPIPFSDLHRDIPVPYRLPQGIMGAQCELVFTMGVMPPHGALCINRQEVWQTILSCRVGVGLVGRRSLMPPSSHLEAVADFSLHVATICGPHKQQLEMGDLDEVMASASIDGNLVARTPIKDAERHPIDSVSWLNGELVKRGSCLNAGDIVATGSITPILQVLPGQRLEIDAGPIGRMECTFG